MSPPPKKPDAAFVNLRGEPLNLLELIERGHKTNETPRAQALQKAKDEETPVLATTGPMPSDLTLDTVWDALCLAGCERPRPWLLAFLQHLGWKDSDDKSFTAATLNTCLALLVTAKRVHPASSGRVNITGANRHSALQRVLLQPRAAHAWKAWARASSAAMAPAAEVPRPQYLTHQETLSLGRLLLYGGLDLDTFSSMRNRLLGYGAQADLLAMAWGDPFMPELWERADPALHNSLVSSLAAAGGLASPALREVLLWQDQATGKTPARFSALVRFIVAERALARGDVPAAEGVLHGMAGPGVDLARAAIPALQGHWAAAVSAFALALKVAVKETKVKRGLAPPSVMRCYVLALLQSQATADWTAARKLCIAESGTRAPPIHSHWGLWVHAIDARLGDATLMPGAFDMPSEHILASLHRPDFEALSHRLVLAAWLDHSPQGWKPESIARVHKEVTAAGSVATAALVRAAAVRLRLPLPANLAAGAGPAAATDPYIQAPSFVAPAGHAPTEAWADSFFGVRREAWRDALAAIEALGEPAAKTAAAAGTPPLQWRMVLDSVGRVASLEPFERTLGARGYGKPKRMALARLKKAEGLAAADAAVARCVQFTPYSRHDMGLDVVAAAIALVGHPDVVFADAPEQPVDLREGLPLLEVRRQRVDAEGKPLVPQTGPQTGPHAGSQTEPQSGPATGALSAADGLAPGRAAASAADATAARHAETEEVFVFHLADPLTDTPAPRRGLRKRDPDDDLDELHFADVSYLEPAERERRNLLRVVRDAPDRARLIRVNAAQRRVAELVAKRWAVPVQAKAELDAALRVLAGHFQLHSDATAGQELDSEARLRALLSPQGQALQLRLVAQPFGDFGPVVVPGMGRERLLTLHEGLNLATQRQLAQETAHLQTVLDAVPALAGAETGDCTWLLEDPEQALAMLEQLPQLSAIRDIAWPRGKPVRVTQVLANALQIKVSSGTDWLGLNGELQLSEGRVLSLQRALELAHEARRSRFVALGEGEYLALTEQLKRQLADLAALAQPDGAGVKLPQAAAAWLAETLDAAVLKGDSPWAKRLKRLNQAAALEPAAPAALQAQLRSYQLEGYAWMVRLAHAGLGACLADDMGLGKTVQTLGLLINRAALGPALVLAPTSVCSNWVAEAARFAPGLKFTLYGDLSGTVTTDGSESEASRRAVLGKARPGEVIVASYALMQIDEEAFAKVGWATLVMDEAQALKNAATKRAKAVASLQADFRLALTGTPVENRLADLWSIMNIVNPGLLGSAARFSERFAGPIERERDEPTRLRLRRLVSPFLLRRTKAQVLTDLPPRTEIIHRVEPGPEERAFLEAARRAAQARVAEASLDAGTPGQAAFHVLAELTRLRRAACDPRLVAPELGLVGAKVHEFEQLATELVAGRHKALVFSQFTDFLALLVERLKACGLSYQYLDGSTPAAERGKRVEAFQRGEGDLFLISLKAGGFGLNLTAADYVIIVDPWWNPAAEDQALGRAHRIGQQRPVTVYRLVTAGSVEERIVALHGDKRQLADGILSDQDSSAPLRADDLRELLRDA